MQPEGGGAEANNPAKAETQGPFFGFRSSQEGSLCSIAI